MKCKSRKPYRVQMTVEGIADLMFGPKGTAPYEVEVTIKGIADLLFPRKHDLKKVTGTLEDCLYRNARGQICIPGSCLRGVIIRGSRLLRDPRDQRRSAVELFKTGVRVIDELVPVGPRRRKKVDYADRRICPLGLSAGCVRVTRVRPAMRSGWEAKFRILVMVPTLIPSAMLHAAIRHAGEFEGVMDFRPMYGRFRITKFDTRYSA